MKVLVNVNGTISDAEHAKVSALDRGFLFGDGVYETGRTYDRCPLFWEEHLVRLKESARKLFIPMPWSDEEMRAFTWETLGAFDAPDVYFRVIISRGPIDHVGLDVLENAKPTRVCIAQELSKGLEPLRQRGMRVRTSSVMRNSAKAQDPNIKTSNYLNSLLALHDVKQRGADDGILCDARGFVTEGTTFAVFGVTPEGVVFTPSLDVGILDSITRRHVLSAAIRLGLPVEEGLYRVDAFQNAAEVFLASSVREVIPISEWDDTQFKVPGRATLALHEAFREEIKDYVSRSSRY